MPPPTSAEIQRVRAELAQLEAAADAQQQVVTRLEAWARQQGRLAELDARLSEPDSVETVAKAGGGEALAKLNDELLTLSVDIAQIDNQIDTLHFAMFSRKHLLLPALPRD